MGSLKPGATYVYERANGRIYAREFGKLERHIVGYDLDNAPEQQYMTLWNDILKESETNPALQKALDRAIMIYRLSKDNPL
jgi:hypothetical protein